MSSQNFSRRSFLGSVAGGTALAPLAGNLLQAQEYRISGADLKLGVASYSFRKFTRAQAIEMTKQLGTSYLNVKSVHLPFDSTTAQIEAAKKEFAAAGIVLVGCGNVDFQKDDEADMRQKFEYALKAGFPLMVCAPTHITLPKLEKFVVQYNIKIAVHNHGPEDKNFPTPQSVLEVVKDMDPRCGLCIDIGHTSRTGKDIVESIAEAGPRLLDMHTKDLADPMAKESQVAVGEGKLPIPKIFAQLVKMQYKGSVNLEYEINDDNPMPGMQKSFAYMRSVLAGLQKQQSA